MTIKPHLFDEPIRNAWPYRNDSEIARWLIWRMVRLERYLRTSTARPAERPVRGPGEP